MTVLCSSLFRPMMMCKQEHHNADCSVLMTSERGVCKLHAEPWFFFFSVVCFFFPPSLLACVSKVNGIDGGAGFPPANQVLGLSSLAGVEALGPRGSWGLGWRGGGWRGRLLSWGAVAWVPGTDGQTEQRAWQGLFILEMHQHTDERHTQVKS